MFHGNKNFSKYFIFKFNILKNQTKMCTDLLHYYVNFLFETQLKINIKYKVETNFLRLFFLQEDLDQKNTKVKRNLTLKTNLHLKQIRCDLLDWFLSSHLQVLGLDPGLSMGLISMQNTIAAQVSQFLWESTFSVVSIFGIGNSQ